MQGVFLYVLHSQTLGKKRELKFIDRTSEGFLFLSLSCREGDRERDRKVKLSSLALLITFHSSVDKMNVLNILQADLFSVKCYDQ